LYKKQTKVYDTVTGNCHWVILAYILGDHYRVLRVVENDWKKKKKRSQLDSIGRARPSLWAKYAMGNFVIKTLKYSLLVDLHNALHRTLFTERRRPQQAKFFDSSKSKIGYQALQNRIGALFDTLNFENYEISLTFWDSSLDYWRDSSHDDWRDSSHDDWKCTSHDDWMSKSIDDG